MSNGNGDTPHFTLPIEEPNSNSDLTNEVKLLQTRIEVIEAKNELKEYDVEYQRAQLFTAVVKNLYRFCAIYCGAVLVIIGAHGSSWTYFELDIYTINLIVFSTAILMWRVLSMISNAVLKSKQ